MYVVKTLSNANLLLITFDQWRGDWGDPSDPVIEVKTIRELASRGWASKRCYTSSPQCVPARMSWLTGKYPSQVGITQNCSARIREDTPSIFRDLRNKGWYTSLIGKTHWTQHNRECDLRDNEELIKSAGFDKVREIAGPRALRRIRCELTDLWEAEGVAELYKDDLTNRYNSEEGVKAWEVKPTILPNHLYPDIWIGQEALKEIKSLPYDQPWLLWISFVGPHEPFDTPEPWSKKRNNLPTLRKQPEWIGKLDHDCTLYQQAEKWGSKLKISDEVNEFRNDYANRLLLLDNQVEGLIKEAKKRTDFMRTAICLTSDHGEMLGDYGLLYKSCFLEPSVRVPMIYCEPEVIRDEKEGIATSRPTSLSHLIKTIVGGLQYGGGLSNVQDKVKKKKIIKIEYGKELCLVTQKKKLVVSTVDGQVKWAIDLLKDPYEENNVHGIEDITKNPCWERIINAANKEMQGERRKNGLK